MGDPGPLEKLDDFVKIILVPGTLQAIAKQFQWDKAKLDDIKKQFRPHAPKDGSGCMKACYDVIGILYSEEKAKEIQRTVNGRAIAKANAFMKTKASDELVKKFMLEKGIEDEAEARRQVRERLISNEITSDHTFGVMREMGLASDKVHVANADAEQSLRAMTGNQPGVYFFGMAVKDYHTVTLAVERGADGSQKMYWLDQQNPGLKTEIKAGQLEKTLNGINYYSNNNTSNLYALKPPTGGGAKP